MSKGARALARFDFRTQETFENSMSTLFSHIEAA